MRSSSSQTVARYTSFIASVMKQMFMIGHFPHTERSAWSRDKVCDEVAGAVAYHPDAPKPLRKNVRYSRGAVSSQFTHICKLIRNEWGAGQSDAWQIVSSPKGIYCTNKNTDPNLEKMYQRKEAELNGKAKAANAGRRSGDFELGVTRTPIPFRRRS